MCKLGNQQIPTPGPLNSFPVAGESMVMGKGTSKLRKIHNLSEKECTAAWPIEYVLHFIAYVQIYKHEREPVFSVPITGPISQILSLLANVGKQKEGSF